MAEDHDGLREMARATLEGLGYQVKLARDGEEAIHVFQAQVEEIALVLLDVVMPKLGGPQLYAQLSAAKPDLPVIFTTGYSTQIASLSALLEKGIPVLRKPYTPPSWGAKSAKPWTAPHQQLRRAPRLPRAATIELTWPSPCVIRRSRHEGGGSPRCGEAS